jgi:hypothetical protein
MKAKMLNLMAVVGTQAVFYGVLHLLNECVILQNCLFVAGMKSPKIVT